MFATRAGLMTERQRLSFLCRRYGITPGQLRLHQLVMLAGGAMDPANELEAGDLTRIRSGEIGLALVGQARDLVMDLIEARLAAAPAGMSGAEKLAMMRDSRAELAGGEAEGTGREAMEAEAMEASARLAPGDGEAPLQASHGDTEAHRTGDDS